MTDFDPNVSPPLKKPLRTFETAQKEVRKVRAQRRALGICECGRGMMRAETEQCESCDLDGQANVVDLDFERMVKVMEGKR